MAKNKTIVVKGTEITIMEKGKEDFISLTDMVKGFEDGLVLIEKWLRNKNTIEFTGIWEEINNPDFNSPEFGGIKNEAGINSFTLSVKKWITKTNAIGIIAKTGRYRSGTFAHRDIAFEFGSWLTKPGIQALSDKRISATQRRRKRPVEIGLEPAAHFSKSQLPNPHRSDQGASHSKRAKQITNQLCICQ